MGGDSFNSNSFLRKASLDPGWSEGLPLPGLLISPAGTRLAVVRLHLTRVQSLRLASWRKMARTYLVQDDRSRQLMGHGDASGLYLNDQLLL